MVQARAWCKQEAGAPSFPHLRLASAGDNPAICRAHWRVHGGIALVVAGTLRGSRQAATGFRVGMPHHGRPAKRHPSRCTTNVLAVLLGTAFACAGPAHPILGASHLKLAAAHPQAAGCPAHCSSNRDGSMPCCRVSATGPSARLHRALALQGASAGCALHHRLRRQAAPVPAPLPGGSTGSVACLAQSAMHEQAPAHAPPSRASSSQANFGMACRHAAWQGLPNSSPVAAHTGAAGWPAQRSSQPGCWESALHCGAQVASSTNPLDAPGTWMPNASVVQGYCSTAWAGRPCREQLVRYPWAGGAAQVEGPAGSAGQGAWHPLQRRAQPAGALAFSSCCAHSSWHAFL